jgi:hypothetical protein
VSVKTFTDKPSNPSLESLPERARTSRFSEGAHGQILKSSAFVGGSSALGIVIRIVCAKAMALLFGSAGMKGL